MKSLNKITDYIWELPKTGRMRVPGRIYASKQLIDEIIQDPCIEQVRNVAYLPGIVKYSLAMPDIHWGYGFPIGGVAAMDIEEGVISPGGVGYDINCGVRMILTDLKYDEIKDKIRPLLAQLFRDIPTGVGSKGAIPDLSKNQLHQILTNGSEYAVKMGYGNWQDVEHIEEKGCLTGADPYYVSDYAKQRGKKQMGTLGSGNHFLEIGYAEEIFLPKEAEVFHLEEKQVALTIHTGSRGLGYQICDDYLKTTQRAAEKYNIPLPDRQLACAPIQSPEGKTYLGAMRCAANFAFCNRQVIKHLAEKAFMKALSISLKELNMRTVYDICHNIAKIEKHTVDGKETTVCVHRKGATRAFGPHHPDLPETYKSIGQPVFVPGDMGRYSYLCIGTENAMKETFGSSCHGAGRVMSRKKSSKVSRSMDMFAELKSRGVEIIARGKRTIAEEMPHAYKDVANVVNSMEGAGIVKNVAKFKPVGVIKG